MNYINQKYIRRILYIKLNTVIFYLFYSFLNMLHNDQGTICEYFELKIYNIKYYCIRIFRLYKYNRLLV